MSRPLPAVAARQCGVFLTEQALAEGWTPRTLQAAVAHGRLDRLWRGVFAHPVAAGPEGRDQRVVQRAVGAALSNNGVAVSHLASAALWEWSWWAPDPRACVTTGSPLLTAAGDVHVHRSPIPLGDGARYGDVRATAAGRTVVDIAREFGTEAGLVTADAALRSGRLDRDELAIAVARAAGRPGVGSAREVLELADARAESVLESRSRWRVRACGLPAPRPQAVVLDTGGREVARVDFLWEEWGIVGEADGRAKYLRDMSRRTLEGRRREALERLGLIYVSWGWEDLAVFEPTATRIRDAMARAVVTPGRRRAWRIAS